MIKKWFIDSPIQNVTTKNIADFLYQFINEGKMTIAKLLRASLIDCSKEALANGLMLSNPAELTKSLKVKIQRSRLSLDDFYAILKLINDNDHWLTKAMKLALVTGQRVSDIAKLKWNDIYDNKFGLYNKKLEQK